MQARRESPTRLICKARACKLEPEKLFGRMLRVTDEKSLSNDRAPISSREIARTPRAHGLISMLAAGNAIRRGQ
jgi:hypothetical protein